MRRRHGSWQPSLWQGSTAASERGIKSMQLTGSIAVVVGLLAVTSLVYGQGSAVSVKSVPSVSPRSSGSAKKDGKIRPNIAVTPEREAAVMTFVQRNHVELADLLGYLKTSQPEEYERAIKDIFRTTERLAAIQERDPLQYELEIAA